MQALGFVPESLPLDLPTVSEEEEWRRDVLLKAAELIESKGYISGDLGMEANGPYCILGAVKAAAGIDSLDGYIKAGYILRVSCDEAWMWSDYLKFAKLPRRPRSLRRVSPKTIVANTLRRLANGESWSKARQF